MRKRVAASTLLPFFLTDLATSRRGASAQRRSHDVTHLGGLLTCQTTCLGLSTNGEVRIGGSPPSTSFAAERFVPCTRIERVFNTTSHVAGGMYGWRGPSVPLRDRGSGVPTSRVAPSYPSVPSVPARTRHAWARLRPGAAKVEALGSVGRAPLRGGWPGWSAPWRRTRWGPCVERHSG